jgi:hypothetical protein
MTAHSLKGLEEWEQTKEILSHARPTKSVTRSTENSRGRLDRIDPPEAGKKRDALKLLSFFCLAVVPGTRKLIRGSGFQVLGSGFRVQGSRSRVQGSRFWVLGSRFWVLPQLNRDAN